MIKQSDSDLFAFLFIAPEPILVFTNKFDVRLMTTSGGDYRLVSHTLSSSSAAIDIKDEMIYWTDIRNKTISRVHKDSNLKTQHKVEIVLHHLDKPEALAIDWISRKLYWLDTGKNTISVSNLDGSHTKTLITGTDAVELRTLAVYPEKGFVLFKKITFLKEPWYLNLMYIIQAFPTCVD